MSYILDALRKAERERGMNQVPTLMTDHAPRNLYRNRVGLGLGIAFLGMAVMVAAYYFHERHTGPIDLKSAVDQNRPAAATATDPGGMAAVAETATPSPIAVTPSDKPAATPATARAALSPAQRDTAREQVLARRPPPQVNIQADEDFADDDDMEPLPPREIMSRMAQSNARTTAGQAAAPAASFKDSVAKMTLSLLMYADRKEERMVYINGSRYHEGAYVAGIYVLEKITEEGAVLSYEGERILLQPKSK
jgi:general secretion pathway protein B